MTAIDLKDDPKAIEPAEQATLVSTLLSVIDQLTLQLSQQAESLAKQSEKIDELLSEIRQLKKLSKKPKLRASNLPKDDKDNEPPASGNNDSKRPGSSKRSKNKSLTIDREELIGVENVPMGSVRKGNPLSPNIDWNVGYYLMVAISLRVYLRNYEVIILGLH